MKKYNLTKETMEVLGKMLLERKNGKGKKNIPTAWLVEQGVVEQLAEQLHDWYLEATKELNPESFNPNAQKKYNELTEQQKQIDRYIAKKLLEQIWEVVLLVLLLKN